MSGPKRIDAPIEARLHEAIPGTNGYWSFEQRWFANVTVPTARMDLICWRGRFFYREHSALSQDFMEIQPKHVVTVADDAVVRR